MKASRQLPEGIGVRAYLAHGSERWEGRWWLPARDGEQPGDRKRDFDSEGDALAWAISERKKAKDGRQAAPEVKPLKWLLEERWKWMAKHKKLVAGNTKKATYSVMLGFFGDLLDEPVGRITSKLIERCFDAAREARYEHGSRQGKLRYDWERGTPGKAYDTLKALLDWCVDQDYLEKSPLTKIPRPDGARKKRTVWTRAQRDHFFAVIRGSDDAALCRLFAETGPRIGEIQALWWDQLDLERDQALITLDHTIARDDEGRRYRKRGTKHPATSNRTFSLSMELTKELRALRLRMRERFYDAGLEWTEQTYVFPGQKLERFQSETTMVATLDHWMVTVAELPRLQSHEFRHTDISIAAIRGVPDGINRLRHGHGAKSTVHIEYQQMPAGDDAEWAEWLVETSPTPVGKATDFREEPANQGVGPIFQLPDIEVDIDRAKRGGKYHPTGVEKAP